MDAASPELSYHDALKRYHSEPMFKNAVAIVNEVMRHGSYTPGEMRSITKLATIIELRRRDGTAPDDKIGNSGRTGIATDPRK